MIIRKFNVLDSFIYFYKTSRKFRKLIIAAFAFTTFFFSGVTTSRAAGEAAAFTTQPQYQNRPNYRSGFFSGRLTDESPGFKNQVVTVQIEMTMVLQNTLKQNQLKKQKNTFLTLTNISIN